MKVRTIDGQSYKWQIKGEEVNLDRRDRSALHISARSIIRDKYPTHMLVEEVPITVRKGKTLYFDFYMPLKMLAIEVHGEQHYIYSAFFHKSPKDFLRQKKNDMDKQEWCDINGINLIVLPFNQQEEWGNLV